MTASKRVLKHIIVIGFNLRLNKNKKLTQYVYCMIIEDLVVYLCPLDNIIIILT